MTFNSRLVGLLFVSAAAVACATASVTGKFPSAPAATTARPMHLFVMPAGSAGNPSTGNEGFPYVEAQRLIDEQVLAVARGEDPTAALAPVDGATPYLPMEPYIAAAAPARVTAGELNAAGYALSHSGTHLLVPTIIEWRQRRSDDPIGALVEPHNRVVIELRLVRLDPAATEGDVTFTNHARTTFNQPAIGLLGDEFRKVVRRLLA